MVACCEYIMSKIFSDSFEQLYTLDFEVCVGDVATVEIL